MEIQSLERILSTWRSPACAVVVCPGWGAGQLSRFRLLTMWSVKPSSADAGWQVRQFFRLGSIATKRPVHLDVDPRDDHPDLPDSSAEKESLLTQGASRPVANLPSIIDKRERRSSRNHLHIPRATEP